MKAESWKLMWSYWGSWYGHMKAESWYDHIEGSWYVDMYQAAADGLESWYVHIERDPGGHPCLQNCHLLTAKTGQQNVVIRHFVIYFGKFGLFFEKLFWTVVKDKASVFLKLSQSVLPSSPCDSGFRWMNDRVRLTCQPTLSSPPLSKLQNVPPVMIPPLFM